MIVEGYTADAYCDHAEHKYGDVGHSGRPGVFYGPNKRFTDKARKLAGWRRIQGSDICPICAKLKFKLRGVE